MPNPKSELMNVASQAFSAAGGSPAEACRIFWKNVLRTQLWATRTNFGFSQNLVGKQRTRAKMLGRRRRRGRRIWSWRGGDPWWAQHLADKKRSENPSPSSDKRWKKRRKKKLFSRPSFPFHLDLARHVLTEQLFSCDGAFLPFDRSTYAMFWGSCAAERYDTE